MMVIHKWPDSFALEIARSNLIGGAWQWWRTKERNIRNFNDFVAAYEHTFLKDEGLPSKWKRMTELVQHKGELLNQYFHTKVRLCSELKLTFADTKEQILIGLFDRNMCSTMLGRSHVDTDNLFHDLMEYERINIARVERIRDSKKPHRQSEASSEETKGR
ncbi:hypothetical protein QE152_g15650 [Popillia japonica]|uniref:Retrotransposon gag domain-containing protein n=1 Tax=Popillia japonica TaxID=7064 RepID=A0AAW1L553_POPJA